MKAFLSLLPWLALAAADAKSDTNAVCEYLYDKYPKYFAWDTLGPHALQTLSNASTYHDINSVYWNAQNRLFRAACAFFPGNAEQVSDAVKQLNKHPEARFALKSGGHQPAPGFSSTDGGVIISFEPNLADTVRTEDGKHFIVGPGARWGDSYAVTQKTNQVVVGGRLSHIGVGGFAVGGGLSFYSAQYFANLVKGLTCDNVDQWEVVLADGTALNATRDENADLWWALRGGGNQFAIVTRMWMQAHPLGDNGKVWGGTRAYSSDKKDELFKAVANFVRDYPDKKAAVIPTFQFGLPGNLINAIGGPLFFFFYDGETPPPGVFDEFDAIDALSDETGTKPYTDITGAAGGASLQGFGASFRELTFPNLPTENMTAFYDGVYDRVYKQSLKDGLLNLNIQIMGFDPQPVSKLIAQASQDQGGNALGLDPSNGDRIWIENNLLWTGNLCNDNCPTYSEDVMNDILDFSKSTFGGMEPTNYESGDVDFVSYNPLFMNDAAPNQDVYSSYGQDNLQKLQATKQKYDPSGFFTNRQGGFKLPS
ncbi:hypothetical protein D0861_05260 [Hortaea werneckii]|uniref:FAD-binding PCMH-type domain-containing protein n=1 Tax=Hortaea werneckii TaxID=91943 RepID=A0A3M7FFH7_HORWE|nr:hypothetical protein D0861_05260 [Hortaea werneckii]